MCVRMANMATLRRSPRLASLRQTSVTVRERLLEKFLVHNHDVLALIQSFLKHSEDQYSDITSVLVQAEVELNKLKRYLVITRRIKSYSKHMGPIDAFRVIVEETGYVRFLVYDRLIEEANIAQPTISNSPEFIEMLKKINDRSLLACPGINNYLDYKNSIGFDVNRVVICKFPPRDTDCATIYKGKKSFKTLFCSKCQSLKWMLCRRKKEHDDISPTHRMKRQSTSSNCPFDFLSPMSKKARYENTSKTNTILRSKLYGLQKKIERITTVDVQNNEIGELVSLIAKTDQKELCSVYSEAESMKEGCGTLLKKIWEENVNDWECFQMDQAINSKK